MRQLIRDADVLDGDESRAGDQGTRALKPIGPAGDFPEYFSVRPAFWR